MQTAAYRPKNSTYSNPCSSVHKNVKYEKGKASSLVCQAYDTCCTVHYICVSCCIFAESFCLRTHQGRHSECALYAFGRHRAAFARSCPDAPLYGPPSSPQHRRALSKHPSLHHVRRRLQSAHSPFVPRRRHQGRRRTLRDRSRMVAAWRRMHITHCDRRPRRASQIYCI